MAKKGWVNMKILFDLHTHTISSGHAYSTLQENIVAAQNVGLLAYGFSDHAESLPGTVKNIYFHNLKVVPREIDGLLVYRGVEANIIGYDGAIDCDNKMYKVADYIIASLHTLCIKPSDLEANTQMLLKAMDNPYIKILGHPDDGRYPLDYPAIIKKAKEKNIMIELNNSSLSPFNPRVGARENIITIMEICKEYQCMVVLGSDSHFSYSVGKFDQIIELIKEHDFPEDLIANLNMKHLDTIMRIVD